MDLTGRRILVSGASSGLGKEIAHFVASLGGKLILVARDASRLDLVLNYLPGGGHSVECFDLYNTDQIVGWMKSLAIKHGPLNGLVHCAGILKNKPLRFQEAGDWESAMKLNVNAAAALTKGFRQKGVYGGAGSIVFMASVMGISGQPGQSIYSATKGALIAMARSLALELAREGIRVNCVAPALVQAGMSEEIRKNLSEEQFARIVEQHPLGLGRPEDVANAVGFLLADTGRWITGTTLVVDGGYTAQ